MEGNQQSRDMTSIQNHGLVLRPITKDQWTVGSRKMTARLGAVSEINPSGDWTKHTPKVEFQVKNGYDNNGCVLHATSKALVAQANYLEYTDFPKDTSERYWGVMANTSIVGTDPHYAIEVARTRAGLLKESKLPWTTERDYENFYHPKPMDEGFIAEAQKILRKYELNHEWIWNGKTDPKKKRELLKQALKRGTVCVSVRAWEKTGDLYTKEVGAPDTHWVWLVKYDGEYPIINDQYAPVIKKLDKDYDFGVAKLYILTRNTSGIAPFERDYFSRILQKIAETIKRLALKYGFSK